MTLLQLKGIKNKMHVRIILLLFLASETEKSKSFVIVRCSKSSNQPF